MVPEQQSDYLSRATAHVRFVVGDGNDTMVVDGTPDFSGKTLSSFTSTHTAVYIFVGECQSSGVRDPEVQLTLNTLGMDCETEQATNGRYTSLKEYGSKSIPWTRNKGRGQGQSVFQTCEQCGWVSTHQLYRMQRFLCNTRIDSECE